ncbi:MAG: hypothetical protein LUD07_03935 [Clostridiales bacterium]|nr:hypothetical protein [Clostridiales bacterium]
MKQIMRRTKCILALSFCAIAAMNIPGGVKQSAVLKTVADIVTVDSPNETGLPTEPENFESLGETGLLPVLLDDEEKEFMETLWAAMEGNDPSVLEDLVRRPMFVQVCRKFYAAEEDDTKIEKILAYQDGWGKPYEEAEGKTLLVNYDLDNGDFDECYFVYLGDSRNIRSGTCCALEVLTFEGQLDMTFFYQGDSESGVANGQGHFWEYQYGHGESEEKYHTVMSGDFFNGFLYNGTAISSSVSEDAGVSEVTDMIENGVIVSESGFDSMGDESYFWEDEEIIGETWESVFRNHAEAGRLIEGWN